MTEKSTIQDIARLAGVSKATVSRVLNQKPDVDPTTRERILRIIEEQGYTPNFAASSLAGGHSRLIALLIPSFTWPLIPDIMRGVAETIEQTQYELLLYSISDIYHEEVRSEVIHRILETKLTSGLLAIFPGPTSRYLATLHSPEFPVVLLDDQEVPPENVPWITINNRLGAYEATHHLLQMGHRRIAHIQGPLNYQVSRDRFQGYCEALEEAGLSVDSTLVVPGDFKPASGQVGAKILFDLPERPTAIFAASDYTAYGVMTAAREYGLRLPEDIALVGFDDLPSSAHMHIPLSTVRQPFYEMGQVAITLLLSLIETPYSFDDGQTKWKYTSTYRGESVESARKPLRLEIATPLIVRTSSRPSTF